MATTEEQLRILQERVFALESERAEMMREATIYKFENVPEPTCSGWWWALYHEEPFRCWERSGGLWSCSKGKSYAPWWPCSSISDSWTGPIPAPMEKSTIPAQPPPLTGKPRVSDEAIADEIRAAAMMLLDGVLHAAEWLAAARRVRAMIEERAKKKEDE